MLIKVENIRLFTVVKFGVMTALLGVKFLVSKTQRVATLWE